RRHPRQLRIRTTQASARDHTTFGVAFDLGQLLVAHADLVRDVVIPDTDHEVDRRGEDALDFVPDLLGLGDQRIECFGELRLERVPGFADLVPDACGDVLDVVPEAIPRRLDDLTPVLPDEVDTLPEVVPLVFDPVDDPGEEALDPIP